jgi:hypothetical protein
MSMPRNHAKHYVPELNITSERPLENKAAYSIGGL